MSFSSVPAALSSFWAFVALVTTWAVTLDFFGGTAEVVVEVGALGEEDGGTMMPMGRVKGIVMDS